MSDFFTEVRAIVLSNATKAEKINKLVKDLKCSRYDANKYYTLVQYVEGEQIAAKDNHRRFTLGIEIECYNIDKNLISTALSEYGIQSIVTGYNHNDQKKAYKLGSDGSIDGYNSCEVVSPILRSLNTLKKVCKVLNDNEARVNRSCGLHVHFGAESFTIKQWQRIIVNYAIIEPIIDSFMPQSRRANNNRYCKSIINIARNIKGANITSFNDLIQIFNRDRYYKLNIMSFVNHKTIEFRQHQGTTNFEKINQWVKFLSALINHSLNHTELITATTIDELPFLTASQKKFFNDRKNLFNE